jgi:predicted transcriptional regulator
MESRNEYIMRFIEANPGAHLRQIRRVLDLPMGATQYHLRKLEMHGKIVAMRRGLFRRFYPSLNFGEKDCEILGILFNEMAREILLYVIENPGTNQATLAEHAGIGASTVNWHIKRLKASGLIEARHEGRSVHYLAIRVDEILRLLRTYHPGTFDRWADRLTGVLSEIG